MIGTKPWYMRNPSDPDYAEWKAQTDANTKALREASQASAPKAPGPRKCYDCDKPAAYEIRDTYRCSACWTEHNRRFEAEAAESREAARQAERENALFEQVHGEG